MTQKYIDALGKLGLRREEAKIYLACLSNKQGLFVREIVELSGVNRSTVDLNIRRLLEKHFLGSFLEGRRKKYSAAEPERIIVEYQRNIEGLRSVIPRLMNLGSKKDESFVSIHNGAEGIKAIHEELLETMKSLPVKERISRILSSGRNIENIQPRLARQVIKPFVRNQGHARVIAAKNANGTTWDTNHKESREAKLFDGRKYSFNCEMLLLHDKTMFISTHEPVGGITIKNKTISGSLQSLFDMLWDFLGPSEAEAEG